MSLGKRDSSEPASGILDTLLRYVHLCDRKLKKIDSAKLQVKEFSCIVGSELLGASVTTANLETKLQKLSENKQSARSALDYVLCCRKRKQEEGFQRQLSTNLGGDGLLNMPMARLLESEYQSPDNLKQYNHLQNLVDLNEQFKKEAEGKAPRHYERGFHTEKAVLVTSQLYHDPEFETPTVRLELHNPSSIQTSSFSTGNDQGNQNFVGDAARVEPKAISGLSGLNKASKPANGNKGGLKVGNGKGQLADGQKGKPLGHSHLPSSEARPLPEAEGRPKNPQNKFYRNFDIDQYLGKTELGKYYLVKHLTRSLFIKFTQCHVRGNWGQLKKGRASHTNDLNKVQVSWDTLSEEGGSEKEESEVRDQPPTNKPVRQVNEPIDPKIQKFFEKRYTLFSKYDEGVQIDQVGWYSVTPERVAKAVADRLVHREKCGRIMDFFSGLGGNSIQFALAGVQHIDCIELDPVRHKMAIHNSGIYGVADKITHIQGDVLTSSEENKYDVVFASPPWGGTEYSDKNYFSIFT